MLRWIKSLILAGVVFFFVGIIYGQYGSRLVHPKKIDEQFIWLKGVHPDFLAKYPEWPYPN